MIRWTWVLGMALLVGCGRESADELFAKGEAATHKEATYPEAEAHLKKFLDFYPDDPRADLVLHALARVLLNRHKFDEAIGFYETLVSRFPESRYADQAQFMIGYAYDLQGKYQRAREAYQKVIEMFPKSELYDDAAVSIRNLGKPPEEWFPVDSTSTTNVN